MNTDENFDHELISRVTPALDRALSAPPSAAVAAAISAAAHTRARTVRFRRRARLTLSFTVPLAACLAIMFGMWRGPDTATRDPLTSLLTLVELSPETDDDYYAEDDDDFVYEEIQYATVEFPNSPFAIFSHKLVALQDYPMLCGGM